MQLITETNSKKQENGFHPWSNFTFCEFSFEPVGGIPV